MRVGVMLAAGESTRLPNKALLPTRDGTLVIESGLRMLRRSGVERIVVVVRRASFLKQVLDPRGWTRLEYVTQDPGRRPGVPGAIRAATQLLEPDDEMVVTFCDNVFSYAECVEPSMRGPVASVRRRPPVEATGLDWHDGTQWQERREHDSFADVLAGWYLLRAGDVLSFDWSGDLSSVDMLNRLKARAHRTDLPWHDVGTEESYRRYITGE